MTPEPHATVTPVPVRLGRYELLRSVGRGGMAEVFLARSRGPGGVVKLVCVKRILPAFAVDPRAAQRFADEARATLSLQHANIVPVFELGREGQELFLVMEWIDGCDLDRLLARARAEGRGLSATVAAFVAAEVGKALAYAHDRHGNGGPAGLVHRDVTPRNVLLSRTGEVRLTDFGIARALGASGAAAGTARYMAPEQARGEPPAAGDDLYALGLVLFEMLAGRPLRGTNEAAAAREPVVLEPHALDGVPSSLAGLVGRLLAPLPEQRLRRAGDLQAALAQILAAATLSGDPDPRDILAAEVRRTATAAGKEPDAAGTALTDAAATVGTMPAPEPVLAVPAALAARSGRPGARAKMASVAAVFIALGAAGFVVRSRRAETARAGIAAPESMPVGSARQIEARSVAAVPAAPRTAAPQAMLGIVPRAPEARASSVRHPAARRLAQLRVLAPGSWVAVYLDGRKLADDAGTFSIPAGRHQLTIENPPLHFREEETINAGEGQVIERTYHPGS